MVLEKQTSRFVTPGMNKVAKVYRGVVADQKVSTTNLHDIVVGELVTLNVSIIPVGLSDANALTHCCPSDIRTIPESAAEVEGKLALTHVAPFQ